MSKAPKKLPSIVGRWRITEMEAWDSDWSDEEQAGFIQFDAGDRGESHFGDIHSQVDYRIGERDGKPGVEWSWEGNDRDQAVFGRGWAVLQDDGSLTGMIFFHDGEKSSFRADKSRAE